MQLNTKKHTTDFRGKQMLNENTLDGLRDRVELFHRSALPGQPIGTSYAVSSLVTELWQTLQEASTQLELLQSHVKSDERTVLWYGSNEPVPPHLLEETPR